MQRNRSASDLEILTASTAPRGLDLASLAARLNQATVDGLISSTEITGAAQDHGKVLAAFALKTSQLYRSLHEAASEEYPSFREAAWSTKRFKESVIQCRGAIGYPDFDFFDAGLKPRQSTLLQTEILQDRFTKTAVAAGCVLANLIDRFSPEEVRKTLQGADRRLRAYFKGNAEENNLHGKEAWHCLKAYREKADGDISFAAAWEKQQTAAQARTAALETLPAKGARPIATAPTRARSQEATQAEQRG